jgi:drug/metabolite transporter (DMT)-like permease
LSTTETRKGISIGILLAIAGAFGFSAKAILIRMAYRDAALLGTEVNAVLLLTLRMAFSVPFFVAMAWWVARKNAPPLTSKDWRDLAILGFFGYYLSSFLDFAGLEYISAALERVILFSYPGIVLLLNAVLHKAKIRRREIAALILSSLGVVVSFWNDLHLSGKLDDTWKGAMLVGACSITYAVYLVGITPVAKRLGSTRMTGTIIPLSSLYVAAHFAATQKMELLVQPAQIYWLCVGLAVLSTVIPIWCTVEAIRRIGSNRVSLVGFIGPVITMGLGSVLLAERITPLQLLGMGLVMAGVALVSTTKS